MKATGIVRRIDDLGRVVIPTKYGELYVYVKDPFRNLADLYEK